MRWQYMRHQITVQYIQKINTEDLNGSSEEITGIQVLNEFVVQRDR